MPKDIADVTAQLLLKIKAISLSPHKPFRFTSGILSPIYIDNRIVMSYPKVREKIIGFYIKTIKEKISLKNVELLSGTAMAAIPQTAFIAQKLNLPMVFVRDSKKGHGKQNQIEGVVKKGQRVLVIEDHVSTGGSTIGNVNAIKDAGGKVKYVIATTTYLMKSAQDSFNKVKVKVFYLTDFNKIIDVAIKQKYIKPKDKELILEWAKDPAGWGKKFGFEK